MSPLNLAIFSSTIREVSRRRTLVGLLGFAVIASLMVPWIPVRFREPGPFSGELFYAVTNLFSVLFALFMGVRRSRGEDWPWAIQRLGPIPAAGMRIAFLDLAALLAILSASCLIITAIQAGVWALFGEGGAPALRPGLGIAAGGLLLAWGRLIGCAFAAAPALVLFLASVAATPFITSALAPSGVSEFADWSLWRQAAAWVWPGFDIIDPRSEGASRGLVIVHTTLSMVTLNCLFGWILERRLGATPGLEGDA